MEAIVKRLKEIDTAATAILEHVTLQKQEISRNMEQRTKEFDETLQKETGETLQRLQAHMDSSTAHALKALEEDTEAQIEALKSSYRENHSQMAGEIFEEITGSKWAE